MGPEEELRLPPGYRLDRSDPDLWTLRRPRGWVVAHFSARGATKEAIEKTAWEDHEESTHDYIHHYRGYWSDGGKCRIRIYQEDGQISVVICSQLPDNDNTSVTNMAEYLAAEVTEEHSLPTPLTWIEHYPEHEGEPGEYSLVQFCGWEPEEVRLGGVGRYRVGSPRCSSLSLDQVGALINPNSYPTTSGLGALRAKAEGYL